MKKSIFAVLKNKTILIFTQKTVYLSLLIYIVLWGVEVVVHFKVRFVPFSTPLKGLFLLYFLLC